jgi:hypothetical protein
VNSPFPSPPGERECVRSGSRAGWKDAGLTRSFPEDLRSSRAARGEARGARRERPGRAAREGGGRLRRRAVSLFPRLLLPRPARRHWKAARAARRRVIYRAGCAHVTEPGLADGAADALGRGAESAGLRAGRRRQWASVCAAAAAARGRGRGAGGRSLTPLAPGHGSPKGNRPLGPAPGRAARAYFLFSPLFYQLVPPAPASLPVPRLPLPSAPS